MELISSINLKLNNNSEYEVYADDTKIDHLLYTEEVGKSASKVSKFLSKKSNVTYSTFMYTR